MNTHITALPRGATDPRYASVSLIGGRTVRPEAVIMIEVAARRWGRLETTPHQKWNATFEGSPLVTRHRDPEHAACRALLAMGITGKAAFVHTSTGMVGMVMDIAKAAKLSIFDDDERGLRHGSYRPFDASGVAPEADGIIADTQAAHIDGRA